MEPKRRTRGFQHEAGQETGGGGGKRGVCLYGVSGRCVREACRSRLSRRVRLSG